MFALLPINLAPSDTVNKPCESIAPPLPPFAILFLNIPPIFAELPFCKAIAPPEEDVVLFANTESLIVIFDKLLPDITAPLDELIKPFIDEVILTSPVGLFSESRTSVYEPTLLISKV